MKKITYLLYFFLLTTQVCFGQWVQVGLNGKVIKDVAVQNQNMFAVTSDSILNRSTDAGNNWVQIVDSSATDIAISLTSKLFLLKENYPMLRQLLSSTDLGDSWNVVSSDSVELNVANSTSITVSPIGYTFFVYTFHYRDTYMSRIIVSTNEGITWNTPLGGVPAGHSFSFRGQNILNGGSNSPQQYSLNISDNNGLSWYDIFTPHSEKKVINLCMNGNIICGGENPNWPDDDGIFLTADTCSTWTRISILIPVTGLTLPQGGLLVGTDQLGTFLFSDVGDSLGSKNEGLTNLNIHTLSLDNNGYVYAGTENGLWRRSLSEVTSVKDVTTQPTDFILEQNYPNPFNPSTVISYQLPISSDVLLKVFDVLGNEIVTLVDEYKSAGRYEIEFSASTLPSGVYFYQLRAGEYVNTKKMLLLK